MNMEQPGHIDPVILSISHI